MSLKKKLGKSFTYIRRHKNFLVFTLFLFLLTFFIGLIYQGFFPNYQQNMLNASAGKSFFQLFTYILFNNITIAFVAMFTGFLFGVVPFLLTLFNGYMIGTIYSRAFENFSVFQVFMRFIPHGIFEVPVIIISLGLGISGYDTLYKKKWKSFKELLDVFVLIILPLIFMAALIESLLIVNMAEIVTFILSPRVKLFFMSLFMAYLFYALLKFFLAYLKNRESKDIALLVLSLVLASQLWMATYGGVLKEFFESFSIVLNLLPLVLFLIFLYLEHLKYKEQKDKKMIKGAFQQYVAPSVINEIMKDPDKLKLGGEKKELTIFFSDIRGFTSISETLTPVELVHVLNRYLTEMTDIVLETNGVVDKYMGDAIMAFWGAPIDEPKHAQLACKTSLKMMQKLKFLNEEFEKEGIPSINIGIGLNTDEVVVGNMGSNKRFDYTVMGDGVNLGSRLEGINKQYGTNIILSEFTYEKIKNDFTCRKLDFVKVKGKNKSITIYELVSDKDSIDLKTKKEIQDYETALNLYKEGEFKEALEIFIVLKDTASKLFIERCNEFIKNPPKSWDGVWVMTTK